MSWNYRIVRYADLRGGYGLHEVYYDDAGQPTGMSVTPDGFTADDGPEGIRAGLLLALEALDRPIFDEPTWWVERSGEKL